METAPSPGSRKHGSVVRTAACRCRCRCRCSHVITPRAPPAPRVLPGEGMRRTAMHVVCEHTSTTVSPSCNLGCPSSDNARPLDSSRRGAQDDMTTCSRSLLEPLQTALPPTVAPLRQGMLVRACDDTIIYPRANSVAEERQPSSPVTEASCGLEHIRPLVPPLPR